MTDSDFLLTIGEIAATLVGFTGLATVFLRRNSGTWSEANVSRFWFMTALALGAMAFGLLPLPFWTAATEPARMWRICDLTFAGFVLIWSVALLRSGIRRYLRREKINVALLVFNVGGGLTMVAFLCAAGFAWYLEPTETVYLTALIWSITESAFLFIRIVWVGMRELPLGF